MKKDNIYIDIKNYGTKEVSYYVNCFDRELTILFNDKGLSNEDLKEIEKQLDTNYIKWHSINTDDCCEEYMICNLDTYYKNSIVAVIYDENEEEE